MKPKILVIEDEEDIGMLMVYHLNKEGFDVQVATSGEEGWNLAQSEHPNLILLDWMLPGISGLELCKRLKGYPATRRIPIVLVSAKGEEGDLVSGLETGADDYVTKPFSPKVLVARVRSILRREKSDQSVKKIQVGDLVLDLSSVQASIGEAVLQLTTTEFRVLSCLAQKPGWVFSRYQIVEAVRGTGHIVTDRTVDVLMVGLRKKMGDHGEIIETVRGIGYRLKKPES
jgi:two-component system, OmpR family, alkaline phosphatase synthesis response regulator PhoP